MAFPRPRNERKSVTLQTAILRRELEQQNTHCAVVKSAVAASEVMGSRHVMAMCNAMSIENTRLSEREYGVAVATRDLIAIRRNIIPALQRVFVTGIDTPLAAPVAHERTVVYISDWAETPSSLLPTDVELRCDLCGITETLGIGERVNHCVCLGQVHCRRCAADLSRTPPRQRSHDCHVRIVQMGALINRLKDKSFSFPFTHLVCSSGVRTTTLPITCGLMYADNLTNGITCDLTIEDVEFVVRETALFSSMMRELVVLSPRCEICGRGARRKR